MRLDTYLVENNFYKSRNKASEGILRGEVLVNNEQCAKCSYSVKEGDIVELLQPKKPFVSIGGDKLERAILSINPIVNGGVFIDVGASTGGFTDCLLRYGAKKVYCVDVGENLLDPSLQKDVRVIVMDKTNARFLSNDQFDELADGIVVDCSFISLEHVLPPLIPLLCSEGYILALIKPQFELQQRVKMKNGVLRNQAEIVKILKRLYDFSAKNKIFVQNIIPVTIDKSKNQEFIMHLSLKGNDLPFNEVYKGK